MSVDHLLRVQGSREAERNKGVESPDKRDKRDLGSFVLFDGPGVRALGKRPRHSLLYCKFFSQCQSDSFNKSSISTLLSPPPRSTIQMYSKDYNCMVKAEDRMVRTTMHPVTWIRLPHSSRASGLLYSRVTLGSCCHAQCSPHLTITPGSRRALPTSSPSL